MDIFAPIRPLDVRSFAGPVIAVTVSAGTHLIREGHAVGTFFLIQSGTAAVMRSGTRVGTVAAGDCFGEIDPAESAPSLIGVVAEAPMRLLTFSTYGIQRLCAAIPGTRERILEALPSAVAEVRHSPPAADHS